jgi:L-gulono-1,4-lactone dehydrogenase
MAGLDSLLCGACRRIRKREDPHASVKQAVERLRANPEDPALQKNAKEAFDRHPEVVFSVLKEAVRAQPPPPTPGVAPVIPPTVPLTDTEPDWFNSVGEQRCTPIKKVRPANLRELVNVIVEAGRNGQRVRAVGSGHAFSDIARTDDAVLINPVLLNNVEATNLTLLREDARSSNATAPLVDVQAGISLRNLKAELDNRGLALPNLGGYDAQTISGTFATGTHGSGAAFGPLSSFARAIILVSDRGQVFQVEPTDGITDPAAFPDQIDGVAVTLRQDDEWFRAVSTAMGCMGVVYGYVLAVTPAYSVRETRSATTWDEAKKLLLPELWAPLPRPLAENDHFELVLNPYDVWFRHACIKVERRRVGNAAAAGERQDWFERLLQELSIRSAPDLVAFLNSVPFLSPLAIDAAIGTLAYEGAYTDASFNVFSLGSANDIKAVALELHCDARRTVPTVDRLLEVLGRRVAEAQWYLAGPVGIRWVAASESFLAPEAGRLTCTMELTMLVGVRTGVELVRHVKEEMCSLESTSVRVHWGLDLDFVTAEDVRAWYPDFGRWFDVYKELNSSGMFNNRFTERVGISLPGAAVSG